MLWVTGRVALTVRGASERNMMTATGYYATKRSRKVYGGDDRRQWLGRGMGDVVELFAELGREGLCGFRRVKGGAKLTKCLTSQTWPSHCSMAIVISHYCT